jgi:hypothetical protein
MAEEELPEATFTHLVLMLATTGLMQLGEAPNPMTKQVEPNLGLARHTIDSLTMLQEKTEGHLTREESELLDGLLYELRMKYLEKTKRA